MARGRPSTMVDCGCKSDAPSAPPKPRLVDCGAEGVIVVRPGRYGGSEVLVVGTDHVVNLYLGDDQIKRLRKALKPSRSADNGGER
ncbi:MAG: hypothetical protein M3Q10_09320 [Chloroflexota bacterium]|nr:hypothetical protein [Chloroflexota bacterium]